MAFSCTTTYSKPRYNPGVRRNKMKRACETDTYFDEIFVHSDYQEKDKETLELNKARIPKLRSSRDDKMKNSCTAKLETLVSMEEIRMQLQRKNPTTLSKSALCTLSLERRDIVPKPVLRNAKQLRAKLNPDIVFSDSSKLSKILSTKGYYVKGSKKLQPKLKRSLAKKSLSSLQQKTSSTSVPTRHGATQTHPSAVGDRQTPTVTTGKTTDSEDNKHIRSGIIKKRQTRSGRIPKPPNRLSL